MRNRGRGISLSWTSRVLMMKGFYVAIALMLLVSKALGVQQFSQWPQDTTVIKGQTAIIRCVIDNLAGPVQWVKDGFALGYDRSIPGFPRYSMMGTDRREFNLMIVNAQLEDDAEYQCQVGPGPNDPRLTASAKLTVHVPCERPTIQGYQNGSVVEVPHNRNTPLQLVCEARNGRPAATIEWFRNEQKVVENVAYRTDSAAGDKRANATSTLSIELHGNTEDNALYRCQAGNNATVGLPPMSTVVTISILYPPDPPVIEGYNDGDQIQANTTILLTCTSRGGNPLGTVVWYRNSERVDSSFTSGGNRAINEYRFVAQPTDHGAVYRCEVTNLMTRSPLAASRTLFVKFPATSVRMSGGSGQLTAGGSVELTCVSSNSNPRSTITWFARGVQIPNSDITNTYQPSSDGGYVTTSKVTVSLSFAEHNVIYTCQATNVLGLTVADAVTLSVLYPPNPPTISGYDQGAIRADQLERLTCIAVGGNPIATLRWYKNGQLLPEAQYTEIGDIARSEIGIVARPDDNGAVYKCVATNAAITTPLEDSVTLTVLFPPRSLTITSSTTTPRAGQGMNLTCTSSSSNPAAEILWLKGGQRIQGVNRGVVDAENGGKNTTNVLHFIPTSSDHNADYRCRATNTLLGLSVNDAVTLNVLFPPEFSSDMETSIEMTENDNKVINLTAYANPSDVTYTLTRPGGASVPTGRFSLTSGMLRITTIKRPDAGSYLVRAENDQGSAQFNFTITVRYSATITNITTPVYADEGGTAFFECFATAYPATPHMVTWTRQNYNMSAKTRQREENNKVYLTVYELTRQDTGDFRCVADNGVGQPATRDATLIVRYAPIITKSPENAKAASNKGETATLTCQAEGAPDITFTWYKDGAVVTAGSRFQTAVDKRRTVEYTGTLRIRNVESSDYGTYNCSASNAKGSDSFLISLHGTSKPDPPYDLQFVNATHNTITIRWTPGFNGGMDQSYRVQYKPTETRQFVTIDVPAPASTLYTITGLRLGTEYEMTVQAFNNKGESPFLSPAITAKTSSVIPPADISTSELQGSDEVPVIIILVVCIVGVFLLTLNVGLILFFVRRRRKRFENASDTTSHTNTFELYGSSKVETALYPVAASDDQRSYGTYDKNMDDFSDDFNRDYEPEYANRPFTPTNLDSPGLGHSHKAYIMENHGDRDSPWHEDPYRVAMPPSKKVVYDNGDIVYDNHTYPRADCTRPKSIAELSDRPGSRPSSRAGKTPPPPPMRTSSRGDTLPPVPARNYGPQEVQPRYAPPPGSLSPNIVANPTYSGPNRLSPTHNHLAPGSEVRGHLV